MCIRDSSGGWQLSSDDVQIQHGEATLAGAVTVSSHAAGVHPAIDARATLKQADVALLTQLLQAAGVPCWQAAAAGGDAA